MAGMSYAIAVLGLLCFIQAVTCDHANETEMEERRIYCARIARVSKRHAIEVKRVNCLPGFEFCYTTTTCCCEVEPGEEEEEESSSALPLVLGLVGSSIAIILVVALVCSGRSIRKRHWPRRGEVRNPRTDVFVGYDRRSPKMYLPRGPPRSAPSYRSEGSLDSLDWEKVGPPPSISGTLPPPPYSEHSFAAVGRAEPKYSTSLYTKGKGGDNLYTKRAPTSRSASVASWMRSRDGALPQRDQGPLSARRSSAGSARSVLQNPGSVILDDTRRGSSSSRAGSRVNAAYRPDDRDGLVTIPSVASSRGSTVAASEVIYASEAGGRSTRAGHDDDRVSHAGTAVSYNPYAN